MSVLNLSLCKHGPNCRRYSRDECTFAHSYEEVRYPADVCRPGLWLDTSHISQGRSAPDLFVGQEYTCAQKARILAYLSVSHPPYPTWVNLYLWFLRHPRYIPDDRVDIGWSDSLKELGIIKKSECNLRLDIFETGVLASWKVSWHFGVDMLGVNFVERMKTRLTKAISYEVVVASGHFLGVDYFSKRTSMHWGENSREYLNMRYGDKMVLLQHTVGNFEGWAWVVRYPQIQGYGWVPIDLLLDTKQRVYLEEVTLSEIRPLTFETSISATLEAPRPTELTQLCGDDEHHNLTIVGEIALCASDGSIDDGEGIAAASLYNLPDGCRECKKLVITAKMFAHGATGSEIIGVALSLHTLKLHLRSFRTAVVFTDSANCLRYFCDFHEPTDDNGWKLYPLISLVRDQLLFLHNAKKSVFIRKMDSDINPAHLTARQAMRHEKKKGWPLVPCNPIIASIPQLWDAIRVVDDYSMRVVKREYIPRMVTFNSSLSISS